MDDPKNLVTRDHRRPCIFTLRLFIDSETQQMEILSHPISLDLIIVFNKISSN